LPSTNPYHQEQIEAISMVREHLSDLSRSERKDLKTLTSDYFQFREEAGAFLEEHFSQICTDKCFRDRLSACCSREGIITFFADVVINGLLSSDGELQGLLDVLQKPDNGSKCIYLGARGCLWKIKPIVCEMFLCDHAVNSILSHTSAVRASWEEFEVRRKRFTWPDQPVLFDRVERIFMDAGYSSTLMYLHQSPGLLRVKKLAKSIDQAGDKNS
jgi:hypothetical protein